MRRKLFLAAATLEAGIEETVLKELGRSPLLDEDPDAEERARLRKADLKRRGALYPKPFRQRKKRK
jgi:hypothetical protein